MRIARLSGTLRITGLALWLCFSSVAFSREEVQANRRLAGCQELKAVFVGFTLVGDRRCSEIEYHPYLLAAIIDPSEIREGVCYSYAYPNTGEKPVYRLLEERLQKAGAEILHSPTLNGDAVHLMIGGPLFQIAFRKGNHQGLIQAVQNPDVAADPALSRQWKAEFFVLRFSR